MRAQSPIGRRKITAQLNCEKLKKFVTDGSVSTAQNFSESSQQSRAYQLGSQFTPRIHSRRDSLSKRAIFNVQMANKKRSSSSASVLSTQQAHENSSLTKTDEAVAIASGPRRENKERWLTKTLFVELGVGTDQHGQNGTKAAVRACKDAISFNSLPAMADLVPGGYGGMKLHVLIAAPIKKYPVDVEEVKKVFPYGSVVVDVVEGGMIAKSGIAIEEMGDYSSASEEDDDGDNVANDDFVVVNAAVSVGW